MRTHSRNIIKFNKLDLFLDVWKVQFLWAHVLLIANELKIKFYSFMWTVTVIDNEVVTFCIQFSLNIVERIDQCLRNHNGFLIVASHWLACEVVRCGVSRYLNDAGIDIMEIKELRMFKARFHNNYYE